MNLLIALLLSSLATQHAPARTPFTTLGGRPLISVTIDDKGPYSFILDTGASGSVIAKDLAEELALPEVGKARVGSPLGGAPIEVSLVQVGNLRSAEISAQDVVLAALDMTSMHGATHRGVLSPKAFADLLVTIDYPRGEVRVEKGALPAPDGIETFEYEQKARLPMITATVAKKPARLHVDSGAPGAIALSADFAASIAFVAPLVDAATAKGVGGEVTVRQGKVDGDVTIGGRLMKNPVVDVLPVTGADGNVGAEFLKDYVLTLDIAHHRVRLIRSEPSAPAAVEVPSAWKRFIGNYGERTISVEGGSLYLQRRGGPRLKLVESATRGEFLIEGLPPSAKVKVVTTAVGVELHVLEPSGQWTITQKED